MSPNSRRVRGGRHRSSTQENPARRRGLSSAEASSPAFVATPRSIQNGRGRLLVLFRHGPAESRDPRRWRDDDRRPLSREGVTETKRAAAGLVRILPKSIQLVSSPAERARTTARILAHAHSNSTPLTFWTELAPGGPASEIFRRLRLPLGGDRPLVLVGHEPTQSELVGYALTGEAISLVHLSKAGAAAVEFPGRIVPGGGRLRWLLTRRQLARLRS